MSPRVLLCAPLLPVCVACTTRPVADNPPTSTVFKATASLSATTLDFGSANCGGASPNDVPLTVTNTGGVDLTFDASVDNPGFTVVSATSGSLEPGQSATLSVRALPLSSSSSAGTVTSGNLVLSTNDPKQTTIEVPLTVTASGAALTLSAPAEFGELAFGTTAAPMPLVLTNTGNGAVDVALGSVSNPAFQLTYAGSPGRVTLQPGQTLPGLTATLVPSMIARVDATAPILTSGSVCAAANAPSPPAIPLSVSLTCH
jgi:HYDIN/CFA65/VesB-like, Ig-like domain